MSCLGCVHCMPMGVCLQWVLFVSGLAEERNGRIHFSLLSVTKAFLLPLLFINRAVKIDRSSLNL